MCLKFSSLSIIALSCLTLAACSGKEEKPRLEGERLSILDLEKEIRPVMQDGQAGDYNIDVPPAAINPEWAQSGGTPSHFMQNLALGSGDTQVIEKIWTADIGRGSTTRLPLNARPIVAAGRVFTLDTDNTLRAFHNQTGKMLWEKSVQHPKEKGSVISGGLAYDGDILFVTSGYNEIIAINPNGGEVYWRTELKAGSRAAPTILNGRVFVITLNNELVALNATSGEILWNYEGIAETTALLGASAPAADDLMVIPAFSTGDLIALRVENGSTVWEESLASSLRFGGIGGLSDIRGLPVIAGERVIAASYGGKIAAFEKNTGERLWQQNIGSAETPWVAGNMVYVLTPNHKLVSLDIVNGKIIWLAELDGYANMKKRKDPLNWTGPIMVNGHLIVSSTAGHFVEYNPKNGQEIRRLKVGKNIPLSPIVADGTLFVLDNDGKLSAYR